jgi:hypothetical protein
MPQPQVINLDDLFEIIQKHNDIIILNVELQFFYDMNGHVTPNQASKQTFGVVSPRTKASNLSNYGSLV